MHELQGNKKGEVLISPRGSLTKPSELPIYPLFKTPLVRKIFSEEIKQNKAACGDTESWLVHIREKVQVQEECQKSSSSISCKINLSQYIKKL